MLLPLIFCLVLALTQSAGSCVCLLQWLWRCRRAPVPEQYLRRRAGARDEPGDLGAHWRKKPEATLRRVLHLAVHGLSCRQIAMHLKRQHVEEHMRVGKSLAAEYIRAHAKEIAERR